MTTGSRAMAAAPFWPTSVLTLWVGSTVLWWIFALLPVSAPGMEWLAAAQQACFGTQANGLPAFYGWMLLIGGPLSWLLAMALAWGGDLIASLHRCARSAAGAALLAGLVMTLALTGAWAGRRIWLAVGFSTALQAAFETPLEQEAEGYVRMDLPAPLFELVDQRGQAVSLASLRGGVVWLTFLFGHCETLCPALVQRLNAAAAAPENPGARAVIVTLDPWRDTPGSLPAIAARWNMSPGTLMLSGPVEAVNRVLDDYRVARERDMRTGDIAHPGLVYVIDPAGRYFTVFTNPSSAALLAAARQAAQRR
jgi:protein SCO1/2